MHIANAQNQQLDRVNRALHYLIFGLVLVIAALIRFWAAPLSAGPDVAQFWAFAEVFRQHGLDFYRFAEAKLAIFPFKLWAYVYPPIWLLILGLALLAVPSSLASATMVDPGWRLAMKTPIILADLIIGALVYWGVPGSQTRKLVFACLWLFNPMVWYNSAVFGQFDAIAAALLLAAIILLERGQDRLAFIIAALAVMTKQHTLIPILIVVAASVKQLGWRRLLENCALALGVGIVISIPFLVSGNIHEYLNSFFFPGQGANYQYPLAYAFGGVGALLTYLHDILDWNTAGYMMYSVYFMVLALAAICIFSYIKPSSLSRGALIGYLLFIAFFYRVNYQYLVISSAMAMLIAARSKYLSERILSLAIALFPAAWMWLFDNSFWFNYLTPVNPWVRPILAQIGLVRDGIPDYWYVTFTLVLMALCLAYVCCAVFLWRKPLIEGRGMPN
jgi:hypothetical protein